MPLSHVVARLTLVCLAGLAFVPTAAAGAETATAESPRVARWLPADPGSRWTYVYTRERRRVMGGEQEKVETLKGVLVDTVVGAAPQVAPDAVEVRSILRGQAENEPAEVIENRRVVLSSGSGGFQIFEREAPNPLTGVSQVVRFEKPLRGLAAGAKSSEPWKAGVEQSGDLRTEYEAEILGVQDAQTPAGLYEKCLVVRTTGHMTGTVQVDGQRFQLDGGSSVTTEWYAPGVGRVLEKHELDQKLRMEDGSIIEIGEKAQFALSAVELASGQSSALQPSPAAPAAPMADAQLAPEPDATPTSP